MSEKCEKCQAKHEWTAHEQPDGSFVVSAGDTTISLISASECGFSKSQARWVGYMLCERICLEHQLAQVRADNQILRVDLETMTRTAANQGDRAEKAEANLKTNAGLLAHQTDLAREAEIARDRAEAVAEWLREILAAVPSRIDAYQDIVGWQPGESRNAFVVEIENGIRTWIEKALAAKPKAPSVAEGEVPMTPEQRKNARERLDLFLAASDGGSPVSRAELAGYLDAALDQMDADEGLLKRVRTVLYLDVPRTKIGAYRQQRILDVLRARLGEAAQGEEADDGKAKTE